MLTSLSRRMAPAAALALMAGSAAAQTYTTTITTAPVLGTVASASSGDTVFTVSASTGAVTRTSGSGVRLGAATARAVVSVACGNDALCNSKSVAIKVGASGSPTRRARSLTNFTVAMGTAVLQSGPSGGNPMTLTLGPIAKNSSATFYLGFDLPVAGDDSGLVSGAGAAGFYVYAAPAPAVPTAGATGSATVTAYRPLSISNPRGLVFGTIVKGSGSGTVQVDANAGQRNVGGVFGLSSPAPSNASYTVTGEGGQTISVSVPTAMTISGPGGYSLNVDLSSTASGARNLSSAIGSAGSYSFTMGGTLYVPSGANTGAYTGSYSVTVQYN